MQVQDEENQPISQSSQSTKVDEQLSAIAYSMDALIPGLYIWFGSVRIRMGGSLPEDNYPGTLHSSAGIALVLPGYRIYSTYQEAMTLDKHKIDGVPQITSRILPATEFDTLLTEAGYTKIGSAPAKGNRIKSWWSHPTFARVEVIYSPDSTVAITAYHV